MTENGPQIALLQVQERIRKRVQAMGEASIWSLLLRFSGPAAISMVVTASYTVVDAIFVGRLGPEALGALTVVFPMVKCRRNLRPESACLICDSV